MAHGAPSCRYPFCGLAWSGWTWRTSRVGPAAWPMRWALCVSPARSEESVEMSGQSILGVCIITTWKRPAPTAPPPPVRRHDGRVRQDRPGVPRRQPRHGRSPAGNGDPLDLLLFHLAADGVDMDAEADAIEDELDAAWFGAEVLGGDVGDSTPPHRVPLSRREVARAHRNLPIPAVFE